MRYYKEARIVTEGAGAQAFIPEGRKQLGLLLNLMSYQKLKQLVRYIRYADGTFIEVSSMFGMQTIRIVRPTTTQHGDSLYMESGLLLYDPAEVVYPLDVYIGTDITSYGGTNIPGTSPVATEYLNGKATAMEDEALPNEFCYRWSDVWTPPHDGIKYPSEIQNDNSVFIAELGASNEATKPELYSGLLRLAVQAKLGAGVNPDALVPDSWGGRMLPYRYGLVRTSDYTYFLVNISNVAGCRAARLITKMPCVLEWLRAGTLNDDDARRFEAWLLSTAVVEVDEDNNQIVFDVVSAAAFLDVLDGRSALSPTGWHYGYGDNAVAGIVTYKIGDGSSNSEYYWETTLAEVVFTFTESDNVWSIHGSLSVLEADVYFVNKLPNNLLWVRDDSTGSTCLFRPPVGVVVNTGISIDAPVAVFYGKDGERKVLRYSFEPYDAIDDPITDVDFPPVCGSGTSNAIKEIYKNAGGIGGWYVQGGTTGATGSTSTEITNDEYFMDINVGATADTVFSNVVCGALAPCNSSTPTECSNSVSLRLLYDVRGGSGSGYRITKAHTSVLRSHVCVLSMGDVDACYFIEAESGDLTTTTSNYEPNLPQVFTGIVRTADSFAYNAVVVLQGIHNSYYYVSFDEYDSRLVSTGLIFDITEYADLKNAVFFSSDGLQDCVGDYATWRQFLTVPVLDLCGAPGMYSSVSYGGDMFYYAEPGTEVVLGGYDTTVFDTFYRRWLGWA